MATLSSRDSRLGLFPELATESSTYTTGVLPAQNIQELIRAERVVADLPIDDAQVQPASMDLRLGPVAYRVQASFLPGRFATVMDRIKALGMAESDFPPMEPPEPVAAAVLYLLCETPSGMTGQALQLFQVRAT